MHELLNMLRSATGPMTDKEVERCIRLSPWYNNVPSHDPLWNDFCKALYGSVDAALALVERCLPGWTWMLDKNESGPFDFVLWADTGLKSKANATGSSAPLAILAALLTTLISELTP